MGKRKDPIVNAFAGLVKKSFSPCKIILFGSRATGKARKDSDYDFIIISPRFKTIEWEDRARKAYHLKRNIRAAMDIMCYTPEEFNLKKKQIGIVQQAVKEGIEIS